MRELSERYGIAVDPRARIWQLSLGEQQRVEILKALYRDARVLILDEPTAVLTPQEAEVLFGTLRQMADDGRTVIFISHKLNEVTAVSDRVTVLRGGKSVATVSTAESTPRSLAALMVGRELGEAEREPRPEPTGPMLELDDIWAAGKPRRGRGPGGLARPCAPARSWRSPASRATASASSPRRSPGCARRPRGRSPSRASRCGPATRAPP